MRVLAAGDTAVSPDALGDVPLFRGLDEEQRRQVIDRVDVVDVDAGEAIVEEGDTGRALFVMLSGRASILTRTEDGDRIQVGSLQAGESFGELGALLREPRSATIVAAEASRLLRVADDDLTALLGRIGPLALALARDLARELEAALGERNRFQIQATPDRVVVPAQDLSRTRSYLTQYYLATFRNRVKRHRLLAAERHPSYVTDFSVDDRERQDWYELFGAADADVMVPFTFHTAAWTMLLMQLMEDLGINFRELVHQRARLTWHAGSAASHLSGTCGLQVTVADIAPTGRDRVALVTDSRVSGPDGTLIVTSTDTFVVTSVDRATMKSLRTGAPANPSMAEDPVERPAVLHPASPTVESFGLALAEDLGSRYGRLSGNLNPVHTSRTAARLLGHPQPYLQHFCLVNLVLPRLLRRGGALPQQLELNFRTPVYVDQTVQVRMDDRALEIVDADGTLLVDGWIQWSGQPAPARSSAVAAPPAVAEIEEVDADQGLAPASVPDVDVDALRAYLDGTEGEVRQRLRRLLVEPRFAHGEELPRQEYRDRVLDWCRTLADEGYGSLAYPRECGGADDPAAAVAAFETIALHDLSLLIKFGVQFGLFGGAILHLGTAPHHERWLRHVGSLALPGCFALTELGHGSDARSIRTTAVYDPAGERFVIHTPDDDARKDYIGNAARHGRMAAVFAQLEVGGTPQGVHAFLVPIRDESGNPAPGVRIEDCGAKLGLNGVDNGRLWFDHVAVPWDALLNRYGHVSVDGVYSSSIENPSARFFTMLSTLVQGRVGVGLAAVSASKSALAIATRYASTRRQFGPKEGPETVLLDYGTHQRRLLPRLATTYALHFALRALVVDYVGILKSPAPSATERMQLETLAAGLKAMATWNATDTIQAGREACGGKGYLAENRFAALKADTDVFTTFEGDNTVLMQLVAKTLLTDYKQQFEDMDLGGLVRFVVGRALAAVVPTPASRNTDPEHLLSRAFQLQAFRSREQLRLTDLARRLKKALDAGTDAHEAFIRHQHRVVETARAHVERVSLERFATAVEACPDPSVKPVLARLCDLFALAHLERDRGWFLEQGLFAGIKTRAIVDHVDRLCRELRPRAVDLVDAFDIPPALLAAPIAQT